jgi:DNA (cytosine-5)-methyltransferase 1
VGTIKYIELFAGIGGFRYGLESTDRNKNGRSKENSAGISEEGERLFTKERKSTSSKNRQYNEQSNGGTEQRTFTCVYANEWDKYANSIYSRHYGEIDTRDITTVPTSDIPDHDLLVGGFPCQAFSVAGKRRGFDDTRGTLFFEIARILSDKKPRYFILENVKGLLSHDGGKTFSTILGVLSDLGYEFEWQVLNSKNFGVPQNRERVFIVGCLRGESRSKVFPFRTSNTEYAKGLKQLNTPKFSSNRIYGKDGVSPNIRTMQGGNLQPKVWVAPKIRRLTPKECERLQGFPDGWTEGISDTQRYKCLGNAVTTNVITAITQRLFQSAD